MKKRLIVLVRLRHAPFLLAFILADSGQGIGFRQCVLHERATLLRFGLADLGP